MHVCVVRPARVQSALVELSSVFMLAHALNLSHKGYAFTLPGHVWYRCYFCYVAVKGLITIESEPGRFSRGSTQLRSTRKLAVKLVATTK